MEKKYICKGKIDKLLNITENTIDRKTKFQEKKNWDTFNKTKYIQIRICGI